METTPHHLPSRSFQGRTLQEEITNRDHQDKSSKSLHQGEPPIQGTLKPNSGGQPLPNSKEMEIEYPQRKTMMSSSKSPSPGKTSAPTLAALKREQPRKDHKKDSKVKAGGRTAHRLVPKRALPTVNSQRKSLMNSLKEREQKLTPSHHLPPSPTRG